MQFQRRLVAGQKLLIILLLLGATGAVLAQGPRNPRAADTSTEIKILLIEGTVEVLRAGTQTWAPAVTNQVLRAGDRLRTRAASQVALRWSDKSVLRLNELGDFQIQTPPAQQKGDGRFTLWQGILYFFHRDRPGNIQFNTRTASAAVRGTEFNLEAEANGRTVLTLIEGEVDLENPNGRIQVSGGEQAIAEPGRVPYLSARLDLMRAIQWTLYYPAALDLEEAGLNVPANELMPSLEAYRRGDLLSALNQYPPERTPQSDGERIYLAALALAVGQVERSETLLGPLAARTDHPTSRLATALQTMIGVVQGRHSLTNPPPQSATEWLVQSYRHQGSFELERALADARTAARQNPRFGFAWARVAELEFSFGRVEAAQLAVAKALTLTPRNAEALALRGFLAAAQSQITLAIRYFGEALAVDPSLGTRGSAAASAGSARVRGPPVVTICW
jgi:tetratricopeptide (TPR) repeat protein